MPSTAPPLPVSEVAALCADGPPHRGLAAFLDAVARGRSGREGQGQDASWQRAARALAAAPPERLHALALALPRGSPTWGVVLMANQGMWEAGATDLPGEVLWSEDPYFARFPSMLEHPAEAYWRLKGGTRSVAAGLAALQTFADDEFRAPGITRFPTLFCAGRVVWHAVFVPQRSALPEGRLTERLVPIVRVPDRSYPVVRLLPTAFRGPGPAQGR